MKVSFKAAIILFFLVTVCVGVRAAETYTYPQLVEKLYDLKALSILPPEGEQGLEWTSYDRSSHYDEAKDLYVNWFSNADGNGYIREEDGRLVMAEMEGPGCIWRIWSATAKQGNVTIYLDGKEVVDLPFDDYFTGKIVPFNRPQLVHTVAYGRNNYTPIPFQKSCKIVADKDYGLYFIIGYTKFPAGTTVPTFSMDLSSEDSQALDKADAILKNRTILQNSGEKQIEKTVSLKANEEIELFNKGGQYAITQFIIKPKNLPFDVRQQREMLRSVTLTMYWDNETSPSVWSPLGDFFGSGPGLNVYHSYPMGMTKEQFYSNWYMPFVQSGRIVLNNQGGEPVELDCVIKYAPTDIAPDKLGYFHANWHRDVNKLQDERGEIDWTLLNVKGKGRYVGTQLQIWNPRGGWWGEGDEKFYIDGEKTPSWFGTGSEDYFGYAWCSFILFEQAYHNQPLNENENVGHVSVNRWHIQDNVPFQNSFDGYIEKYFHNDRPTQYAAVVYWYADKNSTDVLSKTDLKDRLDYYSQVKYPRIINGITVQESPLMPSTLEAQEMGQHGPKGTWTDNRQLWWSAAKDGNVLKIGFDVPMDGTYQLKTRLSKAVDYAIVQFFFNDKAVSEQIDCYQPLNTGVGITDELILGPFEARVGVNVLEVRIVGKNKDAYPARMVGMDYLKVEKVDRIDDADGKQVDVNVQDISRSGAGMVTSGEFVKIYDPSVGETKPWYINDHCFIRDKKGKWHLFGITHAEPADPLDEDNFAHATADSLTQSPWEKQEFALSVDPDCGEEHLWAPYIIEVDGTYYMFYCAGDADHSKYKIHLATSTDLYNWVRSSENPLVVDGFDARDPYILNIDGTWVMYYTATSAPEGGNHIVACQKSKDLLHWSDREVVFTDPSIGTWGGPTESPTVIRRGDVYYLFIGPRGHYRGTCVYKSTDPFYWDARDINDLIGKIDSHAAEVVRDTDGKWYVSHCGWGQGGVYLAPLYWNDGLDHEETSLKPGQ